MKTNIFLVICVITFLFSCSDMTAEDDPGKGRGKGGRNGNGDDGREDSAKNECKGKGYTIYTYGDCPEGKRSVSSSPNSSVLPSTDPVDVLFVLDTSNSMWYYLNGGFQKRFKKFIPVINQLDWRILFTNAGYTSGGFWSFSWFSASRNGAAMPLESEWRVLNDRYYLDKNVEYYGDVFRYTMTRDPDRSIYDERNQNNECQYPPYCSGTEQPLRALFHSFRANKHLTRKEAAFVAIIISNTDENPEKGKPPITAQKIRNEFEKVYGSNKRLIVMNLVVLPGDEKCKRYNDKIQFIFEETNYAKQIAEIPASKSIEGGNYSICLQDYSIVAEGIVHLAKQ